jgi:gluconokinase
MAYILTADLGTTSIKVLAFDLQAKVLAEHATPVSTQRPQPDWAEQDPVFILRAVIDGLNAVYAQVKPLGQPLALSFSTAMHSLIGLDENAVPLTPSIIWSDNRATATWEGLSETQHQFFYSTSGIPAHPMTPLLKLLWLRQNQADLFQKVKRWVGIKDFVLAHLSGEWLCDYSVAGASGLLNLKTLDWDHQLLADLKIQPGQLPQACPSTQQCSLTRHKFDLTPSKLELPIGLPIIVGGSDGCLANLGAAASEADLVATIGTSSAIRRFVPNLQLDAQRRMFCYVLQENQYVIGGGTNAGAVVLEWLKNQITHYQGSFYAFFELATPIPAGSEGLIFLPYLQGERAPWWNPKLRGSILNLDMRHTQAHLVRAAMESIIYNLKVIGEALQEQSKAKKIIAGGGFARSKVWVQMMADVFQLPVHLQDTPETSSLGAAKLALVALELPDFPEEEEGTVYSPNPGLKDIYEEGYAAFLRGVLTVFAFIFWTYLEKCA